MAHVINDECVSCGACAATCPVGAISEGADKYVVDPDVCIDWCNQTRVKLGCVKGGACAPRLLKLRSAYKRRNTALDLRLPSVTYFIVCSRRVNPRPPCLACF